MQTQRSYRVVLKLLSLLLLAACHDSKNDSDVVAGNYLMRYSDGRIEKWEVHSNFEFDQWYYQTESDLDRSQPFFSFHGRWSFLAGRARPVLSFDQAYSLFDYGTWKILDKPRLASGHTAGWDHSSDGTPILDFFADEGYVAIKMQK